MVERVDVDMGQQLEAHMPGEEQEEHTSKGQQTHPECMGRVGLDSRTEK